MLDPNVGDTDAEHNTGEESFVEQEQDNDDVEQFAEIILIKGHCFSRSLSRSITWL